MRVICGKRLNFRFLSKVICAYVLFFCLMFMFHVFYIFDFVFVQRNITCVILKSDVEITSLLSITNTSKMDPTYVLRIDSTYFKDFDCLSQCW